MIALIILNVFLLRVSRSIGMMACIAAYVLFFVTFKPNEILYDYMRLSSEA
jgi:hypothetical protein